MSREVVLASGNATALAPTATASTLPPLAGAIELALAELGDA